MAKLTLEKLADEDDQVREIVRFIQSRIPAQDRQCWSLYSTRPISRQLYNQRTQTWGPRTEHRTHSFWFSRRYAWVGVEVRINFG
jgi:hypothetical protein